MRLESPLIGRHNVMNALAALAAAECVGDRRGGSGICISGVETRGQARRDCPIRKRFTVINDPYNPSPAALNELARLLASTPGYRRRILAAAKMWELGTSSGELHEECGRAAAETGKIDWIFGVQGHAKDFLSAALAAGHPANGSQFFDNSEQAGKFLAGFLQPGDLLLLKGSRGVKMEKILEAIDSQHARVTKQFAGAFESAPKGRG